VKSLKYSSIALAGLMISSLAIVFATSLSLGFGSTVDEQFRAIAENPAAYSLNYLLLLMIAPLVIYNFISLASFDSDWAPAFYATVLCLFSVYIVCVTVAYASQAIFFPRMLIQRAGFETMLLWYLGNRYGLAWFFHQTGCLALAGSSVILFAKSKVGIPYFKWIRRLILVSSLFFLLSFIGLLTDQPKLIFCTFAGFLSMFFGVCLEISSIYAHKIRQREETAVKEEFLDQTIAAVEGESHSGEENNDNVPVREELKEYDQVVKVIKKKKSPGKKKGESASAGSSAKPKKVSRANSKRIHNNKGTSSN